MSTMNEIETNRTDVLLAVNWPLLAAVVGLVVVRPTAIVMKTSPLAVRISARFFPLS